MSTNAVIVSSPASAFSGIGWHAHWIGAEPAPAAAPDSLGAMGNPAPFHRTIFRTTLALDDVPGTVPARLTADSRYALVVNGVEVGRGPARSQPRKQKYDEYDLAPVLREGANTIAVLVSYYGHPTAFWQPAIANGGLGQDAVLAFEARLGDDWLISDADWKVHRSTAWTSPDLEGLEGVPVELVDARELPVGWDSPDFDDSAWPSAHLRPAAHIGGFGRTQPPTDPYGALLPRGTATVGGPRVTPAEVRVSDEVTFAAGPDEHPVTRVRAALDGHAVLTDPLVSFRVPAPSGRGPRPSSASTSAVSSSAPSTSRCRRRPVRPWTSSIVSARTRPTSRRASRFRRPARATSPAATTTGSTPSKSTACATPTS